MPKILKNKKLKIGDVRKKLKETPGWMINKGSICAEFQLENFKSAIRLMNGIAKISEQLGHHPNIFLHDYRHVWVESQTHKENGITEKDISLAKAINKFSKPLTPGQKYPMI